MQIAHIPNDLFSFLYATQLSDRFAILSMLIASHPGSAPCGIFVEVSGLADVFLCARLDMNVLGCMKTCN